MKTFSYFITFFEEFFKLCVCVAFDQEKKDVTQAQLLTIFPSNNFQA